MYGFIESLAGVFEAYGDWKYSQRSLQPLYSYNIDTQRCSFLVLTMAV